MRRNASRLAVVLGLAGIVGLGSVCIQAGDKDGKKFLGKEEKKVERAKVKVTADAQAVDDLRTAYSLAEFGKRSKSPEALVTAARMLGAAAIQMGKTEKEEKGGKAEKNEKISLRKDAMAFLDDAGKMTEDDNLQGFIKTTRSWLNEKGRSPAPGQPRYFSGMLGPRETRSFRIVCSAGLTRAFLQSPASFDLDLKIVGALTGRTMAEDYAYSPNASGEFHSPLPGIFDFIVINASSANASYRLYVN